jgi:hypothetical protein
LFSPLKKGSRGSPPAQHRSLDQAPSSIAVDNPDCSHCACGLGNDPFRCPYVDSVPPGRKSNYTKVGAVMTPSGNRNKRRSRLDCAQVREIEMKGLLVLFAVIAPGAVSPSQTVKLASTHHRSADDPHCSHLRFQSVHTLPSYDAPGFSTVEYSSPDEPFIVPRGCFQFFCAREGETYRVLSCPNLKMKSFSRTMDSNGSQASTSTENSVAASK